MSSIATADPIKKQQERKQQETFSFEDQRDQTRDDERPPMTTQTPPTKPCLQLKGSLVPMTVLELNYYEPAQFEHDLLAKTSQAPDFFENLPVVISLEKLDDAVPVPFDQLIKTCLKFSVKVVAIRGGTEHHQASAKLAGLGVLARQKDRPAEPEATNEAAAPKEVNTVEVVKTVIQKDRQISKLIHHPIRSGQQVYAADGDLIIMASVSAGAEILADGNIHVYGALRGRALAGVRGNTSARIFCHSMEAELVSIAGQYMISEDLRKDLLNKPMQVYISDDALCFKEIVF